MARQVVFIRRLQGPGRRQRLRWPPRFAKSPPLTPWTRKVRNQPYIEHLEQNWCNHGDDGPAEPEAECDKPETCAKDEASEEPEDQDDGDGESAAGENDGAEQDDGAGGPVLVDPCLARVFMRGRIHQGGVEDSHETYLHQNRMVEEFCGNIGLRDLDEAVTPIKRAPNVLLHETSASGVSRKSDGPLRSCQLHGALRAKRYMVDAVATDEVSAHGSREPPPPPSQTLPDADRRHIYIHNLMPCNAAALMASASLHEAQPTRDLLCLHLTRREAISVRIPRTGFKTFAMTVSIPYHTLTDRQLSSSHPLYTSLQVPISSGHAATKKQYLQRAHTTIQVTGFDNTCWTATGLIDSPHQTDSVQHYCIREKGDSDPLMLGRRVFSLTRSDPRSDPRLHFLEAWEERIAETSMQLEGIVYSLRLAAERIWKQCPMLAPSFPHHQISGANSRLQAYADEATSLLDHCRVVTDDLSYNISAWTHFKKCDIQYFRDDEESVTSNNMYDSLANIEHIYRDLKRILDSLKKTYEDLAICQGTKSGNLRNAIAVQALGFSEEMQNLTKQSHLIVKEQQQSGRVIRKFTYASMLFLPLMLASGVFSMNAAVFPFAQSTTSFLYCLLTLALLTMIVVAGFFDYLLLLPSLMRSIAADISGTLRFLCFYVWRKPGKEDPGLPA